MISPTAKKPMLEVDEKERNETTVTIARLLLLRIVAADDIELLGDQLYSLVEESGRMNLIVDFTDVEYLASHFLGKMLGLRKRMSKGRLVLVVKPGSLVMEIIVLCGFLDLFTIFGTVEEALDSF